jgi:crotonobetainyl-CoA:carnitine CoA-transferase CaiB-like acyl-CoA transferase
MMDAAKSNQAGARPAALAGLKVLDASQLFAGGTVGALFGDFGADVIKIEHPVHGDAIRHMSNSKQDDPLLVWKFYSRNKTCITLNLGTPEGAEIFKKLAQDTDILIENFRTGTMERWGLGYDVLAGLNPRLIMVRITAFGQTGPYKHRTGFGTLTEAMCGFAHMTGNPDGPPQLPPLATADGVAGLYAVFSAMFAIYNRDVVGTGLGQVIDVSLLEPMVMQLGPQPIMYDQLGVIQKRQGNRSGTLRNIYQCSDGKWVAVSGSPPAIYARVQRLIGGDALDDRFATQEGRVRHADEMDAMVAQWIKARPRAEVIAEFEKVEAAIAPVYDTAEIMADPQMVAREAIVTVDDADLGAVRTQNAVPKLSRTPGEIRSVGPNRMGAHNDEIYLGRLGMTREELDRLRDMKII